MDNERPIEKLLRRYSKQRRDESRADVKLHPATRRLLQGEVARQFPKTAEKERPSAGAFSSLWAKLAYGLCTVAIVGVIGALVFPALNRAKSTAQFAKADYPAETKAESLSRENQPAASAAPPVATLSVDGEASSRLRQGDALVAKQEESVAEPRRAASEPANDFGLANGAVVSAGEMKIAATERPAQFGDKQRQKVASFSNTSTLQTRAAVLNNFQVEQMGDELRVIDEDGSTYLGNIQLAVAPASFAPSPAGGGGSGGANESGRRDEDGKKTLTAKVAGVGTDQYQSSQNFYFRVAGYNNTLRQNVVFEGNVIPTNQAVMEQTIQSQQSQVFQQFINNSVIIGRAQVEREKEIEINATPVGP